MSREVLLTGSVPREPAAEVFRVAASHLAGSLRRIPDGEQKGWGGPTGVFGTEHPQLSEGPQAIMTSADTPFADLPPITLHTLREGVDPDDFRYPSSGVGDIKVDSYAQFTKMKRAGDIPDNVRFQATLPGPATAGGSLYMPLQVGVRAVGDATIEEISKIVDAIPHDQLTIQLDLANEVSIVEVAQRPDAFDMPLSKLGSEGWGKWELADVVEQVARVANTVPDDVELGFHLCGAWHIDHAGGQDMNVHVDWANELIRQLNRRVDYLHLASIPEHDGADYQPLERLKLAENTALYLGVIHLCDGLDGAKRRIESAARYRPEFGVAHFCGIDPIFEVRPEQLDELLELHRQVAAL